MSVSDCLVSRHQSLVASPSKCNALNTTAGLTSMAPSMRTGLLLRVVEGTARSLRDAPCLCMGTTVVGQPCSRAIFRETNFGAKAVGRPPSPLRVVNDRPADEATPPSEGGQQGRETARAQRTIIPWSLWCETVSFQPRTPVLQSSPIRYGLDGDVQTQFSFR